MVEELIDESKIDKNELAAIGAGAPGVINQAIGEIIFAPNLPWRNYNIRNPIEARFKIPFFIGNDVNVGVLGEWKYGAGINKKNIIGVFVGTGIGGGLVLDNKLFTGSKHAAGELGHMILNTEGPYCNCGQRGCLEAYASKIAMTKEIKVQIDRGRKTILKELIEGDMTILRSKTLKKAIDEKDSLAIEVLDRAIYYLAAGTGNLVNIFNPDMVVLGGGVLEALSDYIMPIFKSHIKRFAWPEAFDGVEVVPAALGDDAVIFGALALITGI